MYFEAVGMNRYGKRGKVDMGNGIRNWGLVVGGVKDWGLGIG